MHVCRLSYSSLTTHPRTSLSFVFLAASHPHAKSNMAFHYFVRSTMFWEKRLWPRFRLKIYKFLFLYQNFLCPHEAFLARFRPSTGILFRLKTQNFILFFHCCLPSTCNRWTRNFPKTMAVAFGLVTLSLTNSSVFTCPYENMKTAFSKIPTLERVLESCVFGDPFHRERADGRPIRKEKVACGRGLSTWTD